MASFLDKEESGHCLDTVGNLQSRGIFADAASSIPLHVIQTKNPKIKTGMNNLFICCLVYKLCISSKPYCGPFTTVTVQTKTPTPATVIYCRKAKRVASLHSLCWGALLQMRNFQTVNNAKIAPGVAPRDGPDLHDGPIVCERVQQLSGVSTSAGTVQQHVETQETCSGWQCRRGVGPGDEVLGTQALCLSLLLGEHVDCRDLGTARRKAGGLV